MKRRRAAQVAVAVVGLACLPFAVVFFCALEYAFREEPKQ